MASNKTIEISSLQNTLQRIYWRVLIYIVIWTSVISLLFLTKSLLMFFLIPIDNMPLMTFLISPEQNSVQDTVIGSFYETILSLLSMMFSFALMMISSKAEKLYIEGLAQMKEIQPFLFSLEINGLPNINSAHFLMSIFETLQGPESKSDDGSLVQDAICVFDMEHYFDTKNEKRFLAFNKAQSQSRSHNQTQSKSETRDNQHEPSRASRHLLLQLHSIPSRKFNGKMILILRDLEVVYDILNLFHCGLFQTKIQSDVDSAIEIGALDFRKDLIFEALNKADKNALFENLSLQLAQDSHDIIWGYYAKSQTRRAREMWCRVFVCLVISCLFSFIVAVIYYFSTTEFLHIVLVDSSQAWRIQIAGIVISTNWKILVATLMIVLLPLLGSTLVEILAEYIQCDYFSDYNNLRFRLEILFEFIHRYVFLHWAFTLAILRYRDTIQPSQIHQLYGYAYIEWNKIAFFLLPTTLLRYLIKYIKNCFSRCANKATPEKVLFSIDHSVSSVNLLLTFMYLGFYFPVLSFSVVALLTVNIILNLFLYYLVYRSSRILRDYLSYSNISMLVNHCLVAFNVGGLLSIFIFSTYSGPYFRRVKDYSGALPSNFIGSVFMLLFAFINYMTNKPNSLYLRVLQQLQSVPLYKEVTRAGLKEALSACDYRKKNPFYKELNRLHSVRPSKRDFLSNAPPEEFSPFLKYDQSYDQMLGFTRRFSKEAAVDKKDEKFRQMHLFAQDLVDMDERSKKDK